MRYPRAVLVVALIALAVVVHGRSARGSGTSGGPSAGAGGAVATSSTTGLLALQTCSGTPTGAAPEGSVLLDTLNHKLCIREGGAWHSITLP